MPRSTVREFHLYPTLETAAFLTGRDLSTLEGEVNALAVALILEREQSDGWVLVTTEQLIDYARKCVIFETLCEFQQCTIELEAPRLFLSNSVDDGV